MPSKTKKSSRPRSAYQTFVSKELKKLRKERPGLKQTSYMKLAAKEWSKFKKTHGMYGGTKQVAKQAGGAKKKRGSKTAKRKTPTKRTKKSGSKSAKKTTKKRSTKKSTKKSAKKSAKKSTKPKKKSTKKGTKKSAKK